MVTLRPYQVTAVARIAAELEQRRSTLLVLATGLGKTVCFAAAAAAAAAAASSRVLVLAHRDELLKQAQGKLADAGLASELEKGSAKATLDARVVVASVQTMRGARLERFPVDHFGLVIADEAHHAMARGYRDVFDRFTGAKLLGVTATPDRLDGRPLGEVFETVAYRYELREAIRDAWLVPIVARRIVIESVDLSQIKTRMGDLAADQLAEAMETEAAVHGVVVPLLTQAGDRPTLVFAVDVAHAHALADRLNGYRAGCARALDGTTSEAERERTLADYEAGAFQFLVNCAVLTEGFDSPATSCIAIARATKSRALVTQMVGRGTRLHPGKRDVLVLDFTAKIIGKHRLMGPADALAGRTLDDDVRLEVERLLGATTSNVDAVIDDVEARITLLRREAELRAIVKFLADEVDPFVGVEPFDVRLAAQTARGELATAKQLAALDKAGVPMSKLPSGFSVTDATRLLSTLARRRDAGLCTLGQARMIAKSGIDTRHLTADRARAMVMKLKSANWVPWALHSEPEATAVREARAALHGAAR